MTQPGCPLIRLVVRSQPSAAEIEPPTSPFTIFWAYLKCDGVCGKKVTLALPAMRNEMLSLSAKLVFALSG